MNKAVGFALFIAGTVVGAAGGYAYTKKKLDETYTVQLNAAREHYKNKYEAKLNEDLKDKISKMDKEERVDEGVKKVERVNKAAVVETEYENVIKGTDYGKYSKEPKEMDIQVKDGPYQVSEIDYDDFLGIERFDITYFKEDDVFMDSREVVWNDGLEKVGADNLFEILNTEDEAFVINEDYGEGYHITIEEGSYTDYMRGSGN